MQKIRVEKRIPFGFKGEWGKVYKLYTFDELSGDIVKWQGSNYISLNEQVQFKYNENGVDKQVEVTQPISNLVTKEESRIVQTTDAYFDIKTKRYECVVDINDIIELFGCFWVVARKEETSIFNPNKQTFYNLSLKKIFDEIIKGE